FGLGLAQLRKGEGEAAIRELERGHALCQTADLPMMHAITTAHLGYAYALSDQFAEGLRLIEAAVRQADSMMVLFAESLWLAWRAEALLLARRMEDAEHAALDALRLARRRRERGNEAWALRTLGEIAARHEPPAVESTEAHYRTALPLADELGMRPLVAHCHLGLGQLFHRTGDPAKTREYLTVATAMYRDMEMKIWLDRAEAVPGRSGDSIR